MIEKTASARPTLLDALLDELAAFSQAREGTSPPAANLAPGLADQAEQKEADLRKIAVVTTVVVLGMSLLAPGARAGNDSKLFQPPEQAQNDHDFAVGNGNHLGTINMGFSAHSGSAGEEPSGYVSFKRTAPEQELRGAVTCLHVRGNEAFIRYLVEKSSIPVFFPEGQEAFVHAVDGGIPSGGTPKDLVVTLPGFFAPPSAGFPCGFHPLVFPLDNGNITINDA